MRTFSGLFCAAFILLAGLQQGKAADLCTATTGNLVANCSFATGDFTDWTLTGNDTPAQLGNLYGVEQGTDPDGNPPPVGSLFQAYFGDLVANATTLSQTLSTVPGGYYGVSLYLAQDAAPTGTCNAVACANELQVTLDGVTVLNQTDVPVEGYTEYSGTVQVTDASSVLNITLGNDVGFSLLDDVVVGTPEPSAWKLALGGMVLVGLAFRRKLAQKRSTL
jgi:hypothetical protein